MAEQPGWRLWGVDDGPLVLADDATHYAICWQGALTARQIGAWPHVLTAGMYAAIPGKVEFRPVGADISRGIVISAHGYLGLTTYGGPIEERGRLRYIDGCTDSLLAPPVRLGDPCLNGLWFPLGIEQTMHSHPSVRIGMIIRGRGWCDTPDATYDLHAGLAFVIPPDGLHRFRTGPDSGMTVIAWHPDSDTGPTDIDHPMVRKTIVDGVSASLLPEIQTR